MDDQAAAHVVKVQVQASLALHDVKQGHPQGLTLKLLVHIHDVSTIADEPLCTCVCARKGQHMCYHGDIMLSFQYLNATCYKGFAALIIIVHAHPQ
jgi:hypothetical protein